MAQDFDRQSCASEGNKVEKQESFSFGEELLLSRTVKILRYLNLGTSVVFPQPGFSP